MGLDLRGEENEQLVEAVSGLCNGMYDGLACGCLTGGACMLALFGGRQAAPMVKELSEWFQSVYGETYGGIDCMDITNDDPYKRASLCPSIVEATYEQARQILIDHGYYIEDK